MKKKIRLAKLQVTSFVTDARVLQGGRDTLVCPDEPTMSGCTCVPTCMTDPTGDDPTFTTN